MTVETMDRKTTFSGGQASLTFAFRTLVSNPEYIKVKLKLVSTGVESDLIYNTGFTVSVNSDGVGGTVVISPTYSTAYNYVVYRETASLQEDEYDDFNQFPASTLENSLDRAIMVAQEQQEETTRALRYPISETGASTELPVPLANAFLQWNAAANALINAVIPDPSTLIKASTVEAQAGVEDTHFMTPKKTADAITALAAITSSTTDITTVGNVITAVNAATGGTNKILRLDASGKLPSLDGSNLTNITKLFMGALTRDMAATDGNVSYTGVGFVPKKITFYGNIDSTVGYTIGATIGSSSTNNRCMYTLNASSTTLRQTASQCIFLYTGVGTYQAATLVSFDSDGFTLAWSKGGSPTGTGQFFYTIEG